MLAEPGHTRQGPRPDSALVLGGSHEHNRHSRQVVVASITVKTVNTDEHLTFVAACGQASLLQPPVWGKAKSEWCPKSIGFFDGGTLTGMRFVLYRQLPRLPRYLVYLPEGPVLDWDRPDVDAHLEAPVAHARCSKTFAVWIGPIVVHHHWLTPTVKAAIASSGVTALSQTTPDETTLIGIHMLRTLGHLGW